MSQSSRILLLGGIFLVTYGCSGNAFGCSKYSSDYSCDYVEYEADYEVWYWPSIENEDDENEKMVSHATGIQQCEDNARAFASATGQTFNYRAYICILMDDGKRMERHRNLIGLDD